jgi:hypothetical protein
VNANSLEGYRVCDRRLKPEQFDSHSRHFQSRRPSAKILKGATLLKTQDEVPGPRAAGGNLVFELTAPDRIVCVPNSDHENKSLEAPFQITVRFVLLRNSYARNAIDKLLISREKSKNARAGARASAR